MNESRKVYLDYMNSLEWINVKDRYMRSNLPKSCYICKDQWNQDFHFYHNTYKRFGKELLRDITPICKPCHLFVRKLQIQYKQIIKDNKLIRNVHGIGSWHITESGKDLYNKYKCTNPNKELVYEYIINQPKRILYSSHRLIIDSNPDSIINKDQDKGNCMM